MSIAEEPGLKAVLESNFAKMAKMETNIEKIFQMISTQSKNPAVTDDKSTSSQLSIIDNKGNAKLIKVVGWFYCHLYPTLIKIKWTRQFISVLLSSFFAFFF